MGRRRRRKKKKAVTLDNEIPRIRSSRPFGIGTVPFVVISMFVFFLMFGNPFTPKDPNDNRGPFTIMNDNIDNFFKNASEKNDKIIIKEYPKIVEEMHESNKSLIKRVTDSLCPTGNLEQIPCNCTDVCNALCYSCIVVTEIRCEDQICMAADPEYWDLDSFEIVGGGSSGNNWN